MQYPYRLFAIPQFIGFFVFVVAAFAETNRLPFDLPEAESELVAGYFTEYSGFRFAMFFLGEYTGMLIMSSIGIALFPWRLDLPEFVTDLLPFLSRACLCLGRCLSDQGLRLHVLLLLGTGRPCRGTGMTSLWPSAGSS